jgi:hypothetical protein
MKRKHRINNIHLFCGVVVLLTVTVSQIFCATLCAIGIIRMLFFSDEIRVELLALYILGLVLMVIMWCFTIGKVIHPIVYAIVIRVRNKIYPHVKDSRCSNLDTENELNNDH